MNYNEIYISKYIPMKISTRLAFLLLLSLIGNNVFSQDFTFREQLDPNMAPFYHGVASGDPLTDRVILWTRVTTGEPSVNVTWRIATDINMSNVVNAGAFITDASRDYTVKVDANGLQPGTWYYYDFEALGKKSIIGRTKTAPTGNSTQLRFATVSCSNWQSGYFNAYDRIRERNDVDAVLHLGDYIYEYGNKQFGTLADRVPQPEYEILSLADYRMRHSSYKMDTMLMRLHQQYPFITVWDDHETANNSYRDGAQNHTTSTEGVWEERKGNGERAYDEWMPIRTQTPDKIWRSFSYGDLADLIFLDTRLYDRDEQNTALTNDPNHHLIGPEQMSWLKEQLLNSTSKWKIIAQQVMFGPALSIGGLVINNDQWDGYQAERNEIVNFIKDNNIDNVVILTGDIHTAWAMDLPFGPGQYNAFTGKGSTGVEFVTTSVTSTGAPLGGGLEILVKLINPFLKFLDIIKHGYSLLDLTAQAAQNDFYYITKLYKPDPNQRFQAGWKTLDGQNHLVRGKKSVDARPAQAQAPHDPMSIVERKSLAAQNMEVIGVYPNPFINHFGLQYYVMEKADYSLQLVDVTGRVVYTKDMGERDKGLQFDNFEGLNLPSGNYSIILKGGNNNITRSIIKM